MKTLFTVLFTLLITSFTFSQNSKRWSLNENKSIIWNVKEKKAHKDHIEMSGLQISAVVHYGIDDNGMLTLRKKLVFPMLRRIPNDTHASLLVDFKDHKDIKIMIDDQLLEEYPTQFRHRGKLDISSNTNLQGVTIQRQIFPSVDKPSLMEILLLTNNTTTDKKIEIINNSPVTKTDPKKGVYGEYIVEAKVKEKQNIEKIIPAGGSYKFEVTYSGRKESDQVYSYSSEFELSKRNKMVDEIFSNLVLETPNDTLNRAFDFAKLRATESIYDTKGGLMHGPGGEAYYAALWANDQAEYANPFFPFLGNHNGNESAINAYRHFARFMNDKYEPIPSSIIAEGTDIWNGAGDRGDMAMIAYGASRYSLATGNKEIAKEMWPLIKWCFEYLERKKTSDGVIASDSDELEGRFSAGDVNLSTNSLTYGAYISSSSLAAELGYHTLASEYKNKAKDLSVAIEKYFGANVQGFNTYRYHVGNDKLRAWICIPMVMGITNRNNETIKALFSDYLWTTNGILTESGSKTFWDRSTLYAFRGLMSNGENNRCMPYLNHYSATRLLGEHVPYPVEAWPEGNQRHLSAESALYCRVITEGLFAIEPTGFNKFTMKPLLPNGWNKMKLKNIKAFGKSFDIEVQKDKKKHNILIKLQNGEVIKKTWDTKGPLEIILP